MCSDTNPSSARSFMARVVNRRRNLEDAPVLHTSTLENNSSPCLMVMGVLALFGCGPETITPSDDASTKADGTSSDETPSTDLPADDPGWCVGKIEGAEARMPMTDDEIACDAEITEAGCEANQACTAVFGRPVQCTDSGACAAGTTEFLGCIPFVICKQGATIYCRELPDGSQDDLLTYASQQNDCIPFGMMACQTSPDAAASNEPPPDCG